MCGESKGLVSGYAKQMRDRARKGNKARCQSCVRGYNIERTHGIVPAEFDELMVKQGHSCAICKSSFTAKTKEIHVDHSHDSGIVRGILCHSCNVALGHMAEETRNFLGAISYLYASDSAPATIDDDISLVEALLSELKAIKATPPTPAKKKK